MIIYADTSFFASLYIPGTHSPSALAAVRPLRTPLLITFLGELEFANALGLRVFRKELSPSESESVLAHFRKDILDGVFRVSPVPNGAFERAIQLSQKHTSRVGTRTLDVLHVAAAITLRARFFYTFDRSQAELARAANLSTL
ncbi:MAG TPA: type II toxin-antitoxin system VapC family toxin [Candidatus Acidoferrum sp.]|nr:type II toxin-antitoxin system VapC family toxin [Candidatus Acidoferrum sp.]